MKTNLYLPRTYRNECGSNRFVGFKVHRKESDLFILAKKDLTPFAEFKLMELRSEIEAYIEYDKNFLLSLVPIPVPDNAPQIIKEMAEASKIMNVGPMASVAGAISEHLCRYLSKFSEEVIVENGGDIFMINTEPVTIGIYAGASPLSMKLGIELTPHPEGIGIATSSGTVGHSLSFGNADAVTVVAKSGSLADAAATAVCNMVKTEKDIPEALEIIDRIPEIDGLAVIVKNQIGVRGESLKLVSI